MQCTHAHRGRPVGDQGELSLVEYVVSIDEECTYSAIEFIHWTSLAPRQGRIVKIREGKVVYSMPHLFPLLDLSGCNMIMPAVGIRMQKVTKSDRPTMYLHILHLKRMWEIAMCSGSLGHCAVCGELPFEEDALTCPLCCLTLHTQCSSRLVEFGMAKGSFIGKCAVFVLPQRFRNPSTERPLLCSLCLRWTGV